MPKSQSELVGPPAGLEKPRHIYTISELTQEIKLILEDAFPGVWVEGEVSNFRAHPSGHFYFTLKDAKAALSAVIFDGVHHQDIKFKLEDGLNLICFGRINVYPPRGQYQIIVEKLQPKGIGSLQLALEQLKQRLEKEGLFSPAHKKPIPYLPSCIGIVTSLAGAAIKDILKVLQSRFKDVQIIINPVRVQGEEAKEEIARAIEDFNHFNQQMPYNQQVQVLIVGRGGGSIEDLWAFNEEIVARAIYNSRIPIISAVGHQRDYTLADLVADFRAPTPSAAAESVIPKKEDLQAKLNELSQDIKRSFLDIFLNFQETIDDFIYRLNLSMGNILKLSTTEFVAVQKKLTLLNPAVLIPQHHQRIQDLAKQIQLRLKHYLKLKEAEFTKAVEKLIALSPLNILGRGYSITFKMPEGEIIKEARLLKSGDILKTKLHKGEIISQVKEALKW